MKFIDIHCHLNCPEYDLDREEVVNRAQKEGIAIINIGTDISMSRKAIEIAEKYENMWAAVGVEPNYRGESLDFSKIKEMAAHPKVVAIGECGVDYVHGTPEDWEKQKQIFIQHIEFANEVGKPLMIHARNGKENKKAYVDVVGLLKEHAKVRSNFHFFAGTLDDAKAILDINGTLSFTGVVTFARTYDEVIKYIPMDRIMSETDAPFVAPLPYRGKRNEPLYIKEIVAALASIRGETTEGLSAQIIDNARNMFGI